MKYSVIFGHFEKIYVKVGDKLKLGSKIGKMGTTGISTGIHTHISVIEGYTKWTWSLASMKDKNKPSKSECLRMLNKNILNGNEPKITNGWLGYENHYGYDFINGREVCWSVEEIGTVVATGSQPDGWGNYAIVNYDTSKVDNNDIIYTVKAGDILSEIAEKYNTTYQKLAEYNNIEKPNIIITGQKIKIPVGKNTNVNTTYTVNSSIGLWLLDKNGKKVQVYPNNTKVIKIGSGYQKYGYNYIKVKVLTDNSVGYMAIEYLKS